MMMEQERQVPSSHLARQDAAPQGEAGLPQPRDAAAGDQRIGIADPDDAARQVERRQQLGAGRLAPVMAAWLERDMEGGAGKIAAGGVDRDPLGMALAPALGGAAGDPASGAHQDAA